MSKDADKGPEFHRGWDAAIVAASQWHAARAKKVMVQARRTRFPKSLEAEAAVHERCAEEIRLLSPDDV